VGRLSLDHVEDLADDTLAPEGVRLPGARRFAAPPAAEAQGVTVGPEHMNRHSGRPAP
jgi:hypothetical protein